MTITFYCVDVISDVLYHVFRISFTVYNLSLLKDTISVLMIFQFFSKACLGLCFINVNVLFVATGLPCT